MSVNDFKWGLITFLEPQQIPRGAASDELNWLTQGTKIETREGYKVIGTRQVGVGVVNGIYTAHKWDGTEVLFQVSGGNLQYFNEATQLWVNIGSNLFAGAAANDLVFFSEYFSPAGAQLWVSSPNSLHLIKIMTANPGNYVDMFASNLNWSGYIKIAQNAMFLWQYWNGTSGAKNTLRRSYVDSMNFGTTTNASFGTGDGATKTFSGTRSLGSQTMFAFQVAGPIAAAVNISAVTQAQMAQIDTSAPHGLSVGDWVYFTGLGGMTQMNGLIGYVNQVNSATEFLVLINSTNFTAYTSGGTCQRMEQFTDDYLGNLKSNLGGTGTVNYTTGAWSVTFNTAPINTGGILGNYQTDNPLNGGIADFNSAGGSPRTAGSGTFFLQGQGGAILNDVIYAGQHFPIHQQNVWNTQIATNDDDTKLVNLPYRENIAAQSPRGSIETGDGIYFIDTKDPSWPYLAVIHYNQLGTQIIPNDLSSEKLDMTPYLFDQAVVRQWSIYIVIACRTTNSTVNNRIILYNTVYKCFDVLDYYAGDLCVYKGNLMAGDSITNNVYQLFSGWDDDGAIPNYLWQGNIDNYGLEELKKTKQFWIEGEIDPTQTAEVWVSIDRGAFVFVGEIDGNGSYVDRGSSVAIGTNIVGSMPVGGANLGPTSHNHYEVAIKLKIGKFQDIQVQYIPTGIGYFSVSNHVHFDIRLKAAKLPTKYRNGT